MEAVKIIVGEFREGLNATPLDKQTRLEVEKVIMTAEMEIKQAEADREKQTAKKPHDRYVFVATDSVNIISGMCSICNAKTNNGNAYCHDCGQKIDWSE